MVALVVLLGWPYEALAQASREVEQAELRGMVSNGQSMSLSRVLDVVTHVSAGEPVDVRLFQSDGLFYRVVVVQPSGELVRLVLDARTGELFPENSPTAKRVRAAVSNAKASTAAAGKSKAKGGQSSSGASGGNDGSGSGNGGGNGNGNGGGNGGGNGNGGGSGGGKGNGGGNGNGSN